MPVGDRGRPAGRTRALLVLLALPVAVTLSLAACSRSHPGTTPPTHAPADRVGEYAALGDSYTAGPLIPKTRLDPLGCGRSTSDYPAFLAAYLRVTSFTDVSCSAAQTRNARTPQTTFVGVNPPQLDALTTDTDLVTLGIGGNDLSLFGQMITTCPRVRARDPHGSPCEDAFSVRGTDTKLRDARRIGARAARVVREIRDRSPHAMIAVVGYPRILPPHGACPAAIPFAEGDYRWADRVEKQLNDSLSAAARGNGASYVDMYRSSRGHDACQGTEAWVNGDHPKPLDGFAYHPRRAGMASIAGTVYRQLTGGRAPHRPPFPTEAPTMTRAQQKSLASQLGLR